MKKTEEEIRVIIEYIEIIEHEYQPTNSIFCQDEYINNILKRLQHLEKSDRRLLILYAEIGSYRKIAEILHISHSTVMNKLNEIKQKLI